MTDHQSTHSHDCWDWGPKHYECAVREIKALRAEVERLRADRDSWEQQASDRVADWHAEYLRAALAALNPWQPIETAPKDGTRVLVCGTDWEDRQPAIAEWEPDYELWATPYGVLLDEHLPDVWSPLPPPPAKESTNG